MKCKVGLLGPSNWAIGSINRFLQKHLGDQDYEVKRFDWDHAKQIWQCFKWCDVFIAEVHMYEKWTRNDCVPHHIRKKGMYVWHHLADIPHLPLTDKIDTRHFTSRIRWEENPSLKDNFFAITKDTKASVEDYYGLQVDMLPVGTEPSFWTQQDIRSIKKIGHVSSPEQGSPDYKLVKRFDMFEDIVEKSGLEGDRVFGKNILTGSYIYKGFDAVVNTSTHEGLPTPLLECAPAKIPFISTNCGIVPQYSSVKTFETVEEAVEILKELNSDEKILRKYVNDVYDDVVPANEYSKIVPEYYVPAIERVYKANKDHLSNFKSEKHLLIDWSQKHDKQNLKRMIEDRGLVVDSMHTKEYKDPDMLKRFYELNLQDERFKTPLNIYIITDHNPSYQVRSTSKGDRQVNVNMYDFKQELRKITSGHIHATDNTQETQDNMKVLGMVYDKKVFKDVDEVFDVLNRSSINYAVMRDVDSIKGKVKEGQTIDINVLTDDFFAFKRAVDGTCQKDGDIYDKGLYRSSYDKKRRIIVQTKNSSFFIDVRVVGDDYFPKKMQQDMLQRKTQKNGMFVLSDDDHKYSLIYHEVLHKKRETPYEEGLEGLKAWMKSKEYDFVTPKDKSIYFEWH